VGSVTDDATAHRDENALRQERSPLLPRQAQRIELSVREEAERLGGPLGDGPVNVAGHGGDTNHRV
jgi:hypothetical protein